MATPRSCSPTPYRLNSFLHGNYDLGSGLKRLRKDINKQTPEIFRHRRLFENPKYEFIIQRNLDLSRSNKI